MIALPAVLVLALAFAPPGAAPVPVAPAAPYVPPLVRAGRFGLGLHVELDFGRLQALSAGSAGGATFGMAVQFDLGPSWALRIPALVSTTGQEPRDVPHQHLLEYGGPIAFVYRWRHQPDQRFVPYLGAGVLMNRSLVGRGLLGLPPVDRAVPRGHRAPDDNYVLDDSVVPELLAGVEWHWSRWWSLVANTSYAYTRVHGAGLHIFNENLGLRLSL
jgi:hypothetical protein